MAYLPTNEERLYLAAIVHTLSRYIAGRAMPKPLPDPQQPQALEIARLHWHFGELIHHSEHGIQGWRLFLGRYLNPGIPLPMGSIRG